MLALRWDVLAVVLVTPLPPKIRRPDPHLIVFAEQLTLRVLLFRLRVLLLLVL
jgi:hypothetical protein